MEIRLRNGSVVLIDEQDADLAMFPWYLAGGKGGAGKYAARKSPDGTLYLHRLIAWRMGLLATVKAAKGRQGQWVSSIDHDNGNKLDDRRSNLKLRNRPQQMTNLNDRPRSTNRSGHRGVSLARPGQPKPWMAYATVNYVTKNLGWFATAEEAATARQQWDEGTWQPAGPTSVPHPCECGCGQMVPASEGARPRLYVNRNHMLRVSRRRRQEAITA